MTEFNISLLNVPAQEFWVPLGENTLNIKIQWQERFGYFRADIAKQNGEMLTAGRIMNIGSDLLANLYPAPDGNGYGSLKMAGSVPAPENFGIDNKLVWSNV